MKTKIKREIMKTKIRTLVAICILGFIGTINVNAANFRNADNKVIVVEGKSTKSELGKADANLVASLENTELESNAKVETFESLLNEDLDAKVDLQKEAQSVTRWIVDQEEARVTKNLLTEVNFDKFESVPSILNEDSNAKVDVRKEAQSVIKLIADQEEAKVVNKLIKEGKL
jgi:hypothetical protein